MLGRAGGLAFLLLASGPALADPEYDTCIAAADADAAKCGEAWSARSLAQVQLALEPMLTQTVGASHDAIVAEQKAWEAFLDKSCRFMLTADYGEGGDITSFNGCRDQVIADRIDEIKSYVRFVDN